MARLKSEEKYDAIIKATLELVTEQGFHGLSMSKIAKAAGVAPATIYIYFENKEAIINQMYLDFKEEVFGNMMDGYKPFMSAKQGFELIWRNVYYSILHYPLKFSFCEQFSNSPFISKISREEGMRHFLSLREFFQRGMQKGEIREMPLEILHGYFFPPISHLTKSVIFNQTKLNEGMLAIAIENAWRAIKA